MSYASEQDLLLRYLHDLGVMLNFSDDEYLGDTNVLNPRWVTEGVYKLLNDAAIGQHNGVVEMSDLARVLDPRRYPPGKRMYIIEMMRKFELCFPLDAGSDRRFLIADLLPKARPNFEFDEADSLGFEYHYPTVLPGSIITRFIVAAHAQAVSGQYWRNGVVLISRPVCGSG